MSIQPYVMETLYKHGSIDYIPYDVLTPIVPTARNIPSKSNDYNLSSDFSSSLGTNFLQSSDSFSSSTSENIVQTQINELKEMANGPLTLYPKKAQNKSVVQNNFYNGLYNYPDSFSYSQSPLGESSGSIVDELRGLKTQKSVPINNQESIRASILSDEDKKGTQRPLESAKIWPKAFISLTAIGLTLYALFKGGKVSSPSGTSFWSKLNPKNWFK